MNRIILALLIAVLFSEIIFAQKVEKADAQKIAKEVFKRNNQGNNTILEEVIIMYDENQKDTLLYIVPFEDNGFVIVAAYRAAPPVLGHCLKGDYIPESMPSGLLYLIDKSILR